MKVGGVDRQRRKQLHTVGLHILRYIQSEPSTPERSKRGYRPSVEIALMKEICPDKNNTMLLVETLLGGCKGGIIFSVKKKSSTLKHSDTQVCSGTMETHSYLCANAEQLL